MDLATAGQSVAWYDGCVARRRDVRGCGQDSACDMCVVVLLS